MKKYIISFYSQRNTFVYDVNLEEGKKLLLFGEKSLKIKNIKRKLKLLFYL